MSEIILKASHPAGLGDEEIARAAARSLEGRGPLRKALIIPPDFTRLYSGAGRITRIYDRLLRERGCETDILPALGTHRPMTREECRAFFGPDIPFERILVHNWRADVVKIGRIPGDFIAEISEGLMDEPIDVEINRRLLDPRYDLILSVGQVVPHEVAGMANYSKNIFVGCGGSRMINRTHMLGAFYGMERVMGRDHSPVRKAFDYAEQHFLSQLPLLYALTVTTQAGDRAVLHGLFIGRERGVFEQAVAMSRQKNLSTVDRPFPRAVVYLDPREFKSTWLGNKAIYRTRMAMRDGGQLLILAPGVERFGEDAENDRLIRKYGYIGREGVLKACRENEDLTANLSVAAHLIHGSSDGRFSITYAPGGLTREEVEGVGFGYLPLGEALRAYPPDRLRDGWQTGPDGEEFFYISNPALGLWVERGRLG